MTPTSLTSFTRDAFGMALFQARPGLCVAVLPDAPHFTIVAASDDFVQTLGMQEGELINKTLSGILSHTSQPGSSTLPNLEASIQSVLHSKKPLKLPFFHFSPTGGEQRLQKHCSVQLVPVPDGSGGTTCILLSFDELTGPDSRKSETALGMEKAYEFFMNAPVIVGYVKGANYVIELANERLLEVWGRTPDVIGKPMFEALPELQGQGFKELLDNVCETGESFYAYDFPIALNRQGKEEVLYFDFVYKAFYEDGKQGRASGVISIGHNVTERKKASEALRQSEERLQKVFSVETVGVIFFNLEGTIYGGNAAFERMSGYSGEDFRSGKVRWDELTPPEFMDVSLKSREELLTKGQNTPYEKQYIRPDGSRWWGLFSGKRMNDNECVEIVVDITAAKEAEGELERKVRERTADLERQTALIHSVLDSSLNAVLALDAVRNEKGEVTDFTIVEINRRFKELIGLDESVVGKSYLEFFPQSVYLGIFEMYREVVLTGKPQRNEIYSTNRNLDSWFEFSVGPRGEDGLVVNFANVSPQREAARQIEDQKNLLDGILKNSPVGITVYEAIRNGEGKIVDFQCILANDADEGLTGIPAEDRRNKTFLDLIPNLRNTKLFEAAIEQVEEGKTFRTEYYREQNRRWLEFSVVKTYGDHFINVFRDITPIKNAQFQLEKHVEDLKRSNANLEEFAYAASHDLKEPIRKIHFFSDRLSESLGERLGEEERRLFNRMEHAVNRMGSLIDDLLAYSQVTRGASDFEDIDLGQRVQVVLEDLELEVQEKGARITVGELPTVKGNTRQFQQLFQNLIANALKYSKPGSKPEIRITSTQVEGREAGDFLPPEQRHKLFHLVEVSDNGIGFEQQEAERIFNVFTRLHGNAEYRGTGVGLSIARKVVENHGGYIWAESTPGAGATFKFLLPAEM
jgi:PAS domain S-box-containing protein